jgi:hypothetical protein
VSRSRRVNAFKYTEAYFRRGHLQAFEFVLVHIEKLPFKKAKYTSRRRKIRIRSSATLPFYYNSFFANCQEVLRPNYSRG